MKRLFLEIDKATPDWIETLSINGHYLFDKIDSEEPKKFFDTIIEEAAFHIKEVWEAIKTHDQIFISSSLIPRYGFGSSFGSAMLMNNLMHKAIEEDIEGKQLYFFNQYSNIWWSELESELVDKCFRKNYLYTEDENGDSWVQVDIDKLLKEI